MDQNKYQKAETIINGDRVYIFLGKDQNEKLLIKTELMWAETLGISYHQFSYKNDTISTVGRKDEEEKIIAFLDGEERFKVNAITGRAGNGKSRLVYHTFKDKKIKKEWSVYGLSYEELQYFEYQHICQLLGKGLIKKKILFVIDYVMINANQIGKWIKQLYINSKTDEGEVCVRILLVERAHVTEARKPYWYMRLVEENRLDHFGLCHYSNHLQIHNLQDDQLREIFVEYVKKNEKTYKKNFDAELDLRICEIEADKIIKTLEKECKTPLYIMYIADSWINDKSRNGRNWNREETLEYVARKEDERIKGFFSGDKMKEAALKRILVFSIILEGVNLGRSRPVFLAREFELLREDFGDDNPNFRHLFNEVGELESEKEITFKSVLPEIVGEFYCLRYLTNVLDNSFDDTYVREFIQYAWQENPRAFAAFLCRVIEDFPEHSLVTFSGILEMPMFYDAENKIFYADVLREYAFWNRDILNYFETICASFENLLDGEKCENVRTAIYEKYAIALFNMAWWCKHVISIKEADNSFEMIFEKMKKICSEENEEIVCQACRGIRLLCAGKVGIKC